jgi:hypothetical protein
MRDAKMYCVADEYSVCGLQTLSVSKMKDTLERDYTCSSNIVEAFHYIMENTPTSDEKVRFFMAEILLGELKSYGLSNQIKDLLRSFPELNEYCLHFQFPEDEQAN